MRCAIVLVVLSACSLVDAFTGAETPFTSIERIPHGPVDALAARGTLIAASTGVELTFIERVGSNDHKFGNPLPIPQPAVAMAMGDFDGSTGEEAVALHGESITVIADNNQNGVAVLCLMGGGTHVVTGDLDGDAHDDIAVLRGSDVIVFFGVSTPPGVDCGAFHTVPLGVMGRSITFAQTKSGARLFVLGQTDLIVIDPSGVQGTFAVNTLAGVTNGGAHVAVGDVDGDGMLDLLHLNSARQLTIRLRTAETFQLENEVSNFALDDMPTGLLTFRIAGAPDGIAIPRMNPGGIDIVTDGDISEVDGAYNSAVTQVFATDLNGDDIDDLISNGETGAIVIALSGD